VNDTSELVLLR